MLHCTGTYIDPLGNKSATKVRAVEHQETNQRVEVGICREQNIGREYFINRCCLSTARVSFKKTFRMVCSKGSLWQLTVGSNHVVFVTVLIRIFTVDMLGHTFTQKA